MLRMKQNGYKYRIHYTNPELLDDPIFWYANRRAAMENESGFIIDEFLNQCAENDDIEGKRKKGNTNSFFLSVFTHSVG